MNNHVAYGKNDYIYPSYIGAANVSCRNESGTVGSVRLVRGWSCPPGDQSAIIAQWLAPVMKKDAQGAGSLRVSYAVM